MMSLLCVKSYIHMPVLDVPVLGGNPIASKVFIYRKIIHRMNPIHKNYKNLSLRNNSLSLQLEELYYERFSVPWNVLLFIMV